jgi:hypothetical protein
MDNRNEIQKCNEPQDHRFKVGHTDCCLCGKDCTELFGCQDHFYENLGPAIGNFKD